MTLFLSLCLTKVLSSQHLVLDDIFVDYLTNARRLKLCVKSDETRECDFENLTGPFNMLPKRSAWQYHFFDCVQSVYIFEIFSL